MTQQNKIGKVATTISTRTNDNGTQETTVRYHATDVFNLIKDTRTGDATLTLKTGGWFTATTKTRINQACAVFGVPLRVFQERGYWFVRYDNANVKPFKDGVAFAVEVSL